jgi:hypothetical protein
LHPPYRRLRIDNQLIMLIEFVEGSAIDPSSTGPAPVPKATDYVAAGTAGTAAHTTESFIATSNRQT